MKMGNSYKKRRSLLAVVLSICICMLSFAGDYTKAEAADSVTVHFLNSEKWDNVWAYVWGAGEALGGWPGSRAYQESGDWYAVQVPSGGGFNIIFNNGNGSQAGNVYLADSSSPYVTMQADAHYASKSDAERADGYVSANTRVYFYNSSNWANVSAYVYGPAESLGGWPGTAAVADGNGWYYAEVPLVAQDGFSIIFNDSNHGNQAADIYINNDSAVYLTAANANKYSSKQELENSLGLNNGAGGVNNSENTQSNAQTDITYTVNLSGVGASQGFTEIEAEDAQTNGEVLQKSVNYRTDIQSEASGRKAVKLDASGEYVEFTLPVSADCMAVRYCIPDGNNGAGLDSTLSMYVNGNHFRDLEVTSRYAWVYGDYPFANNPSYGNGHRFFDEIKVHFGQTFGAGTKIRLQKDNGDTAAYYVIDLADFELSGDRIGKPDGYLSVVDFGAVANDNGDDYDAIVNCIAQAKAQGKGVYLPAGTFLLGTKRTINVSDVNIRGAGMWHTTLYGAGAAFKISGRCQFSDFALTGVSTVRDDGGDLAGFEGYDPTSDCLIQNVWMEHMKVGCWFYNSDRLTVQGCRIRDTYADGINLCSNVQNALVQNNHFRNTGDDAIAIWPWQGNSSNNIIQYNTVQCPTLANCIAVYGGGNNKVLNNHLSDNIAFGAGVNISTNFDTPNGFTGAITVSGNVLERCGSYEHNLNYQRGSIWLFGAMRPITSGVTCDNNLVYDSVYSGVTFDGAQEINNVTFKNNHFYTVSEHAVHVRSQVPGGAVFENNEVSNVKGTLIKNESSAFVLTERNGGLTVTGGGNSIGSGTGNGTEVGTQTGTGNGSGSGETANTQSDVAGAVPVRLYQDINYAGYEVQLWEGRYTLNMLQQLGMRNDDITSLKVPFGYKVTLYADDNFTGNTKVITADTNWIGSDFNDVMSSVVVERIRYRIVSRHSGKCLDISGASTSNGANVIQWDYNGGTNQQWTFTLCDDNSFVIRSVMNGKALDVDGWSVDNGGNIHVWDYGNQNNQKWWVTDLGDGYYSILSKHSNKSLDVDGWSVGNGGNIHQWDYYGQTNQQWKLEAVN